MFDGGGTESEDNRNVKSETGDDDSQETPSTINALCVPLSDDFEAVFWDRIPERRHSIDLVFCGVPSLDQGWEFERLVQEWAKPRLNSSTCDNAQFDKRFARVTIRKDAGSSFPVYLKWEQVCPRWYTSKQERLVRHPSASLGSLSHYCGYTFTQTKVLESVSR